MHHTETDLRDLEEMLLSLPAENDGMLLSEFDGFCAALVVCPEPIPPSDWLPLVWGEEVTPSFARHEDVQGAIALLMAHYNRVARSLMPPSAGYEAIYDSDPINGDTLWEPWVAGFEQAMALRRDSWVAIVEGGDPEAAASVNTMLALHQIDAGTSDLAADSIDALHEAAPDLIPRLVEAISAWTKARSSPSRRATIASTNARPAGIRKVGRNDPCPCGSGQKYKKCCGD